VKRTRITLLVVAFIILLAFALVACGGGGGSPYGSTGGSQTGGTTAGGTTVVEKGFAFVPATLEVKVGDTVTFKNEDTAPHNVRIDNKDLGEQAQGADVTWTADKAGTFPYVCTIHPSMTGEITVK